MPLLILLALTLWYGYVYQEGKRARMRAPSRYVKHEAVWPSWLAFFATLAIAVAACTLIAFSGL